MRKPCTIGDCRKPVHGRGMCNTHWLRWWKYGDPLFVKHVRRSGTFEERFWGKVAKSEGCWIWTGRLGSKGYGTAHTEVRGKSEQAHRTAYRLSVGPIPDGLVLDHLCLNRRCVRPEHLEPVTQAENLRRMRSGVTSN